MGNCRIPDMGMSARCLEVLGAHLPVFAYVGETKELGKAAIESSQLKVESGIAGGGEVWARMCGG